jgi:hypothetical protein
MGGGRIEEPSSYTEGRERKFMGGKIIEEPANYT